MNSEQVSHSIVRQLNFEKILRAIPAQADGNKTLIYVLGGNQNSLVPRFKKASSLYHQGVAGKIHILSRPGITEFSPDLGRNLTNDEWAARELENLAVKKGDVVPVSVDSLYFGTLSEASRISEMVRKKGYRRLFLVSSTHHTRRAYDAFNTFVSKTPVELYVYGAGDSAGRTELLSEYFKLLFYEYVVLPIYGWNM